MFPAAEVPERVGSYRVLSKLATSGGAEVYLARAEGPMGFERDCELKVMPDASDGDRAFAEELAREAAICAKLNHPAVVRVFDFFAHDGKLVLAIEHVDGELLGDLLRAEPRVRLPDVAVLAIGARVAGALADAHAAKDEAGNPTPIVHRNLHPDAVIIGVDGEIRLTGFGLGKIIGRTPDTAIGRVKGTPGYMAPEQARGEAVTPKADVYGLGLLLWSLFTGQRPPTDGTWPRRISGLRSDLPRETCAVIEAALDHFPGTRKITAREIEQWLAKAASSARAKTELKQRVAALRLSKSAPTLAPLPLVAKQPLTTASPYKGVAFGGLGPRSVPPAPAPAPVTVPSVAAVRAPAPSSSEPAMVRTTTATGLGRVTAELPAPETSSIPAAARPPEPREAPEAVRRAESAPAVFVDRPAPPVMARPESAPAIFPEGRREVTRLPPPPPPTAAAAPPARPAPPPLLGPVMPLAPAPSPPRTPPAAPLAPATPPPRAPRDARSDAMLASAMVTPPPAPVAPPPTAPRPAPPTREAPVAAAPPRVVPAAEPSPLPPLPPPRAPLPSLLTMSPGRRSLSPLGSALVSAVTATFVVAVAMFGFTRRERTDPAPAVTVTVRETVHDTPPSASPAPTPQVTASASAAPSAAPAALDPSKLPLGYGLLTVTSPADALVFVSGKLAGEVNKPLRVRCGPWFVRLAAPASGRFPEWVSEGDTVVVPCQGAARLEPHGR